MTEGKGWQRAALLIPPVLAVMVAMGVGIGRSKVQSLAFVPSAADCAKPPVFQPDHNPGGTSVAQQEAGFSFRGEAFVSADLCGSGTLNITASGELGGDELPELTVYLGAEPLAVLPFDQQRTVAVKVPKAGRVFLGFLNDFYRADVRVASLGQIRLTTLGCQDFGAEVPPESAGTWTPQYGNATLVHDPPMTLTPCAAGELTMRVRGRAGNSALPALAFKQDDKTIKTVQTGLEWQEVSLKISEAPLTIGVSNPYGKTLANRNLIIEKLEFTRQR